MLRKQATVWSVWIAHNSVAISIKISHWINVDSYVPRKIGITSLASLQQTITSICLVHNSITISTEISHWINSSYASRMTNITLSILLQLIHNKCLHQIDECRLTIRLVFEFCWGILCWIKIILYDRYI